MKLAQALDIQRGDVVAFVGAGGKTTAMFRLADELVAEGWRVVTTTTTRIAQEELNRAPQRIGVGHSMKLPPSLSEQIEQHRHVFVFARLEQDSKVRGVSQAWFDENLTAASGIDALLVEADGSRRLPMKAPLPHEPVIPASATVVVPVVGMDALGQPLAEETVYGADAIEKVIGYPAGQPVTPRLIAAVLLHPRLGLKHVPRRARIAPLLNKVNDGALPDARQVADYLLTDINVERALVGAVQEADPIREARRRVGAVILAAGESKRMGEPKLLMPWGENSTVIRQVCQQVAACGLYEVVLVAGRWGDAIREQVTGLPVRVVINENYAQGEMLSSLKAGLASIWHSSDACLVVLGDQPLIEQTVTRSVVEAYFTGRGRIVAPSYGNRRGHPILIGRAFWESIIAMPPDSAPRDLIRLHEDEVHHLVVDTDSVLRDIDTPEDYRRAREGRVQSG